LPFVAVSDRMFSSPAAAGEDMLSAGPRKVPKALTCATPSRDSMRQSRDNSGVRTELAREAGIVSAPAEQMARRNAPTHVGSSYGLGRMMAPCRSTNADGFSATAQDQ
jgi:hypothetical protein